MDQLAGYCSKTFNLSFKSSDLKIEILATHPSIYVMSDSADSQRLPLFNSFKFNCDCKI